MACPLGARLCARGCRSVEVRNASRAQVITDEFRVRQVVCNGLTNAIKYSNAPLNGAIRVCVRARMDSPPQAAPGRTAAVPGPAARAQWLCIDVLDCGEGLGDLEGEEATLFTDFAAAVTKGVGVGAPRAIGSSGVGLPICARCVVWRCVLGSMM